MPLFNYKCTKCEAVVEKFQHSAVEKLNLTCICGGVDFVRLFNKCGIRVDLNAKDFFKYKIKPDADRITNNISKGKDKDFLDIKGEK